MRTLTDKHFLLHYGEMVLAMLAGMVVLGIPLGAVLGHGETPMLVNMGVSMTLPMVAWMRFRGHGWRPSAEMAASMAIPAAAALAVHGASLLEFGTVMAAEHVVMLAAMLAVMLARPSEYAGHHAAAA
jgi:hypothetical protein